MVVSVFFSRKDLQVKTINLSQFCIEKNFEICSVQLELGTYSVIVLSICRSPSGTFYTFLNALDSTLRYLYKQKIEFIVCGDLNINFLLDSNYKLQLSPYYSLTICFM